MAAAVLVLAIGVGAVAGRHTAAHPDTLRTTALASLPWTCTTTWYAAGRTTASGEPFDQTALTAATRDLPFGTRLLVTNAQTQTSVVVRVNDRGPTPETRCIDLSRGAFERLAAIDVGVLDVRIERLPPAAGAVSEAAREP